MDNSPIPGFITRKHAAEKCKRVERTLQRYWSKAIELRDSSVLKHLKLRTEDGEIIEGIDVTKELIEKLKKERKNPTWYVHASWVEKTYGPRVEKRAAKNKAVSEEEGSLDDPDSPPVPHTATALLTERIRDLEQDKVQLRDELTIKNEQIKEANERNRETHVLMRDLHALLLDMQKRLPAPETSALPRPGDISEPRDAVVVTESSEPEKVSRSSRTKKRAPKPKAKQSKSRKQVKHKWYEMPTLNRFLNRS